MLLSVLFDASSGVGDKTVVGILVGFVVAEAGYIVKLHGSKAAEIKKIYEERITELKSQYDLVDTLLDVIDRERKAKGR
jgi:hypothetical protein